MRWTSYFLITLVLSGEVQAQFVGNRQGWMNYTVEAKAYYAMGIFDGIVLKYANDPGGNGRADTGLCAFELELDGIALAEIISQQYTMLENWDAPPNVLLAKGLLVVCHDILNRERTKRGEDPLPPPAP